jgi:hypothetical protein
MSCLSIRLEFSSVAWPVTMATQPEVTASQHAPQLIQLTAKIEASASIDALKATEASLGLCSP